MERVDAILQQMLYGRPRPRVSDREREARAAVIERLFALYREKDADLANQYIRSTEEIPLFFLAYAVIAIERSRVYSNLPQIGELWAVARRAAGMDREQYHAGHYLPPPPDPGAAHAGDRTDADGASQAVGRRRRHRGPRAPAAMTTSALLGCFHSDSACRSEFLALARS